MARPNKAEVAARQAAGKMEASVWTPADIEGLEHEAPPTDMGPPPPAAQGPPRDLSRVSLIELGRLKIWRGYEQDASLRPIEFERCKRDVVYWVQRWVWTYDPRLDSDKRILPLVPFPKQEEFLRWLEVRERTRTGGVVCKGRGTGITWLCVAYACHRWLFQPAFSATFASRREDLVDRLGDLNAILPKARFLLSRLPVWQMPRRFKLDRDAPFMRIMNPATGASINGETGDQVGRGGRATLLFLDEAAFVPRLAQVFAAATETTDVEIDISTPGLPGDPFDQRCDRADIHEMFEIDWRDDPRKTPEWAQKTREALGHMVFAREYERDRKISMEGLVIQPAWVQAAQRLRELTGMEPGSFVVAGGDVGGGGSGQSTFVARAGPVVLPPVSWSDPTTTAFRFVEEARKCAAKVLNYDSIGVGLSVTTSFKQMAEVDKQLAINAVNVGQAPDKRRKWDDGKTSAEKFQNLRAELWWLLRDRLEKTFQHVSHLEGDFDNGREHPLDELLALPSDPALAAQLSVLTWHPTSAGKILVESKDDLRRRGVKSPDLADALALTMTEGGSVGRKFPKVAPISIMRENPISALY